MSNPGMRKECKFCGARFGQSVKLCPNCGSADIKLVAGEGMNLPEAESKENTPLEKKSTAKKRTKNTKKKKVIILVLLVVFIAIVLIGIYLLMQRWEAKKIANEDWSYEAKVDSIIRFDGEMSEEEWIEGVIPILDELYSREMDDEIVEIYDHAISYNRPIYEWEHYLYASYLSDFYVVKGIWGYEQDGAILKDYHNTEILYYSLEFRSFEDQEGMTAEEKERLQRYVIYINEDVKERWGLTKEDMDELYELACEEYGYLSYFAVENFLKEKYGITQDANMEALPVPIGDVDEALKSVEKLYGAEWQTEMFYILDYLYENGDYQRIYEIYVKTQEPDSTKSITQWEHFLFALGVYDIYDLELVLAGEAAGEQIKEWQYMNILLDYFELEDFENRTNLTEEEKDKLMPLVTKLREDAMNRWNLSEEEWNELRKEIVSENGEVLYEEVEPFVTLWMEEKGYAYGPYSIEEELADSKDMDDAMWKKRFYPKLNRLYEQHLDKELYEACIQVYYNGRMLNGWNHEDYVDMLGEYYDTEEIWAEESSQEEVELREYDYIQLLYSYLIYEHWETNMSLAEDEKERLMPYRNKILKDGAARWDFTKEEWSQIDEFIEKNRGKVYYYEVSTFIKQWLETQ